ncbi:cytochrome c peroxidase [Kordia periserrulae]|uniref:Cytochrome c peroxidase n=1 Tax=Kordia periserrulae TaxID=701523 RepID=A0A2T6C6U3_9FLAO|nr:cytochrome c peroxidase [Kordia periserrulae]PTX64013.1 cytochrome c peroxidase [Kordia periserrulae]
MKLLKLTYLLIALVFFSCKNEPYEEIPTQAAGEYQNVPLSFEVPSNFPPLQYDIENNPPTETGFELGRRLFYEGRMASDNIVACGFCHIQEFAFTHHTHIVSHGVDGALGSRNAQPLQNLAFQNEFNWDGAAIHLDMQPIIPITNEVEMNESFTSIIAKLQAHPDYPRLFREAFENGEINSENILKALSQFMVMMVSSNSKYDKFRRNEGNVTLTANELQGMELFNQKCASCHAGELFTDQTYRNNGLAIDPQYNDIGRERVTGFPEDRYKFKVPNLRNVEVTFPYMHDGRFANLEAVLEHYRSGIQDTENVDESLRQTDGTLGIPMTDEEKARIIDFLKTLTDTDFIFDQRFSEF